MSSFFWCLGYLPSIRKGKREKGLKKFRTYQHVEVLYLVAGKASSCQVVPWTRVASEIFSVCRFTSLQKQWFNSLAFLFPILKPQTKQKKKGGRSFQAAHRRNIVRGQHDREVTDRKRKQEEQTESESWVCFNMWCLQVVGVLWN